jgi:hypothetical protein
MFLLEIGLFIAIAFGGFVLLRLVDGYVFARHQHRFLRLLGLSVAGSAAWAVLGGYALGGAAGAVFIAAGAATAAALVAFNIKRTGVGFGLAGSAVQVIAGSMIGGLVIAVPAAMLGLASTVGGDDPTLRRAYGDPNPHF